MRNVDRAVADHLNVWAVRDRDKRAAAIAKVYTENVTSVDPDEIVHGRDALNTRIQALQDQFSGLEFIIDGSIQHHHDHAMYAWHQPTPAGDVAGWDVLHFTGDLIDQAVMFIPGLDANDA